MMPRGGGAACNYIVKESWLNSDIIGNVLGYGVTSLAVTLAAVTGWSI